MQTVIAHVQEEVVPPSRRTELDVPGPFEAVVMACLEKDADRRPQTAEDLARMIGESGIGESWTDERAAGWWTAHMPATANDGQ